MHMISTLNLTTTNSWLCSHFERYQPNSFTREDVFGQQCQLIQDNTQLPGINSPRRQVKQSHRYYGVHRQSKEVQSEIYRPTPCGTSLRLCGCHGQNWSTHLTKVSNNVILFEILHPREISHWIYKQHDRAESGSTKQQVLLHPS
jgi:hypothetical protein